MRTPSLLLLGVLLGACTRGPHPPVPIALGEDACAECRMAVSQRQFAAEIVDRGGVAEMFDDLGCLARHLRARPLAKGSTPYVVDFRTGAFVDARLAVYVRAPRVWTPMGSGLIAFTTRAAAEEAARKHDGRLLGFHELLQGPGEALK